jgi:hypothetical protein
MQQIHNFRTLGNDNPEVQKAVVRGSYVTEEKLRLLLGQNL